MLLCQLVLYLTPAERTGLTSQQLLGGSGLRTLMPWLPKKKVDITVQYSNEEHMVDAVGKQDNKGKTWNTGY